MNRTFLPTFQGAPSLLHFSGGLRGSPWLTLTARPPENPHIRSRPTPQPEGLSESSRRSSPRDLRKPGTYDPGPSPNPKGCQKVAGASSPRDLRKAGTYDPAHPERVADTPIIVLQFRNRV